MGQKFNDKFNYRSIIGQLNFLEESTRPDIAYSAHQCARFSATPKESHGNAIEHIFKYLKGSIDDGIILKTDFEKSLEVYVDADFAGNWMSPTPNAMSIPLSLAQATLSASSVVPSLGVQSYKRL